MRPFGDGISSESRRLQRVHGSNTQSQKSKTAAHVSPGLDSTRLDSTYCILSPRNSYVYAYAYALYNLENPTFGPCKKNTR